MGLNLVLYPSLSFSKTECSHDNLDECMMVKIKRDNYGNQIGVDYIEDNLEPSRGDIEFVRKWYP